MKSLIPAVIAVNVGIRAIQPVSSLTCDSSNEVLLEVQVKTDDFGDETDVVVYEYDGDNTDVFTNAYTDDEKYFPLQAGFADYFDEDAVGSYYGNSCNAHRLCIPKNECYFFVITDYFDDGFGEGGGYFEVALDGARIAHFEGTDETDEFSICGIKFCPSDGNVTLLDVDDLGANDFGSDDICTIDITSGATKSNCSDVACDMSNEKLFQVDIQVDEFGEDTNWNLYDRFGDEKLEGGFYGDYDSFEHHTHAVCITTAECASTDECYSFVIDDDSGDGFNCGGGFFSLAIGGSQIYYHEDANEEAGTCESRPVVWGELTHGFSLTDPRTPGAQTGNLTCSEDEVLLLVELQTDEYGEDFTWDVTKSSEDVLLEGGVSPEYGEFTKYSHEVCLDGTGCYSFEIEDSVGDGFHCGGGYYRLTLDGNEIVFFEDEDLGSDCDSADAWTTQNVKFGNCLTSAPSDIPTYSPTKAPTNAPTKTPTDVPSSHPSNLPSNRPSSMPSVTPTVYPSNQPSTTPSSAPSRVPSDLPSSVPSSAPSLTPTDVPSSRPSWSPSDGPSSWPSSTPSNIPSSRPSASPSHIPSSRPSDVPTNAPTYAPTKTPTNSPTTSPTTGFPTKAPTLTGFPTMSRVPSVPPSTSRMPSFSPSSAPSNEPSNSLSDYPSLLPSSLPSLTLSMVPSERPTKSMSGIPSLLPSSVPSGSPTTTLSENPSQRPSFVPSISPTEVPTLRKSSFPSEAPIVLSRDTQFNFTFPGGDTNFRRALQEGNSDSLDPGVLSLTVTSFLDAIYAVEFSNFRDVQLSCDSHYESGTWAVLCKGILFFDSLPLPSLSSLDSVEGRAFSGDSLTEFVEQLFTHHHYDVEVDAGVDPRQEDENGPCQDDENNRKREREGESRKSGKKAKKKKGKGDKKKKKKKARREDTSDNRGHGRLRTQRRKKGKRLL